MPPNNEETVSTGWLSQVRTQPNMTYKQPPNEKGLLAAADEVREALWGEPYTQIWSVWSQVGGGEPIPRGR